MKYALVTGADGFVGRHISAELQRRGWQVHKVEITRGESFADYLALDEAWSSAPYDLVVHCAYHVGGRASIDGVNLNLAKNLALDAALFDWAVRTGQGRVLYFSSSAAYPVWYQTQSYIEDDLFGGVKRLHESAIDLDEISTPDADYGWAKLTGERLVRSARKNGLDVTVVRPFSGYGEDQSADYPFPSIIRRAQAGDLTVWGPCGQTRDWIHISDVVAGALAVVEAEHDGPVNLCTGVGTEMGELARKALGLYAEMHGGWPWKTPFPEVTYDASKPTGVFYRVGDPTLMETFYTPKVSLEEGIARALRV